MLLFNMPIRVVMPQIGREPIDINKNDENYEALKSKQETYIKNNDTHKDSTFFSAGSIVAAHREDGGLWTHAVIIKGNSNGH